MHITKNMEQCQTDTNVGDLQTINDENITQLEVKGSIDLFMEDRHHLVQRKLGFNLFC